MMTKERLEKVRELARRGIGGEKENAQRILDRLESKHDTHNDEIDIKCKICRYKSICNKDIVKCRRIDFMVEETLNSRSELMALDIAERQCGIFNIKK